jgi:(+)-trans-carveol dehydrogenase/(-)-trans-carveol dehydrogenase
MKKESCELVRPELEYPTRDDFAPPSQEMNASPIPWVEPIEIFNALIFLASDEACHIAGVTLPVHAGTVIE